jgi:hypothetical protein
MRKNEKQQTAAEFAAWKGLYMDYRIRKIQTEYLMVCDLSGTKDRNCRGEAHAGN